MKNFLATGPWRALLPIDAANLFASSEASWWIAGGWALDLFRGTAARSHADLDIGVLRRDVSTLLHGISGWEVFEAKNRRLARLATGRVPALGVHSLWCRPTAVVPWTVEILLDEADADTWIYRRDPRIRRSISGIVGESTERLRYLAPEIQLLYKSKAPRDRDEEDFVQTWPLLGADAQRWLHDALELVNPNHHWLSALRNSEAAPTDSTGADSPR